MPHKSNAVLGSLQLSSSHTSALNKRVISAKLQKVYQQWDTWGIWIEVRGGPVNLNLRRPTRIQSYRVSYSESKLHWQAYWC